MATIKVTLDKRLTSSTKDNKFPLVLRIGHKRQTRDISFNIHLKESQYDYNSGKITGIQNSVRHTKRTRKIYSDIDLWVDENSGMIKHWDIAKLKQEIEQMFFKKMPSRSILQYGATYLERLRIEKRFSTASSYEDALKILVKYRKHLKGEDDTKLIPSIYEVNGNKMLVLKEYQDFDMQIIAMDYGFFRDFKAYMSNRYKSKNTPALHLRSLQAIMNDAGKEYQDLKDHKPLSNIKKQSFENAPNPITIKDINKIRKLKLEPETTIWHNRNFLLFMFNNMGMNFFDMAIIKTFQFEDGKIKYFRKKTHYEGDYFAIAQTKEALQIISYYLKDQDKEDYLFPIIPNDTSEERLHKVNNAKVKTFNKYAKRIAKLAKINKSITTYTIRDTWTNIGLDMGIDIRKISSGLGHSSVDVTEKHYGKSVSARILDEINSKITEQ